VSGTAGRDDAEGIDDMMRGRRDHGGGEADVHGTGTLIEADDFGTGG